MNDVFRVVVGMDLEEPGDVALRTAIALAARSRDLEVHVIHVIEPHGEKNLAVLSRALEGGLAALRARVHSLTEAAGTALPISLHVRLGDVVPTIEQVAVDYDADLVIVGTHGRTGARRLVLGSVAAELTKLARLPLLVARAKDFAGLVRTPALDPVRPGAPLHRDQHVSEVIQIGKRDSHIAGMV